MLVAMSLASIALDPPKGAPIFAADLRFKQSPGSIQTRRKGVAHGCAASQVMYQARVARNHAPKPKTVVVHAPSAVIPRQNSPSPNIGALAPEVRTHDAETAVDEALRKSRAEPSDADRPHGLATHRVVPTAARRKRSAVYGLPGSAMRGRSEQANVYRSLGVSTNVPSSGVTVMPHVSRISP
jgi:hypothetical protein